MSTKHRFPSSAPKKRLKHTYVGADAIPATAAAVATTSQTTIVIASVVAAVLVLGAVGTVLGLYYAGDILTSKR